MAEFELFVPYRTVRSWSRSPRSGIGVSDGAANPGFVICTVSAVLFAFIGMGLILMAPMMAEIEEGMLAGALLRLFATEDDLAPKQA